MPMPCLRTDRSLGERCSWLILAMALLSGGALPTLGQTYRWLDASGVKHSSSRFEDAPATARSSLVCTVEVEKVLDGQCLRVRGGHIIRLAGVDAPDDLGIEDDQAVRAARDALVELVGGKAVEIRFDAMLKDARFETLGWVRNAKGTSINLELVRRGVARALLVPGVRRRGAELLTAEKEARTARRGVWAAKAAGALPASPDPFRGFSLGLYASSRGFDYRPFLREMKEIGCRDVLLITPWFVPDYREASFRPRRGRSIDLKHLKKVLEQARAIGLRPSLMPIVLLEDTGDNQWRGSIKPRDPKAWMLAYQEMILRFADCARAGGADLFFIGSELSSMEKHTAQWRALAGDVRRRFGGRLTYSANWDHLDTIRWWDEVDAIGMTGYHSLTKSKEPTPEELVLAWTRIRESLAKKIKPLQKPWFFSELGYASLDGIAANPWDYVSPTETDAAEQRDCYDAWIKVWKKVGPPFRGAFFYTWWRNGNESDAREYSVFGKPAAKVIRAYFKDD